MADELQALLDRINEQGFQKADHKRDEILEKARAEAKRIVQEATENASRMTEDAKAESELVLEKGRESLRQAARDVVLSLQEQLKERVRAVAKACVAEGLGPEAMADIVRDLAVTYMEKRGSVNRLELLLSSEQVEAVEKALKARLGEDLRAKSELTPVPDVRGGFKIVFNEEDVVYDFSEDSLAEAVACFVNPKLSDIVLGK